MRIEIVIPSDAFRRSGGVRLRYQRLMDASRTATIALRPIGAIDGTADAYVFSKTYQSVAPAIAYGLAAKGKPVILDLYDDYFASDATRLQRFRRWLDDMARAVHHVCVSTSALAARVGACMDVPVSVIGDPAPPLDGGALAAALRFKAARRRPDALRLVWFGVASNPYFSAGLDDLSRTADALAATGVAHTLTVVTNLGGTSDAALAALSRLPLRTHLMDWSVGSERHALAQADVAILPVSEEAFQTAKSPNRAMTALGAGAQVLSLGAPIYAALAPFIYRDPRTLMADVRGNTLRLSPERVSALASTFEAMASAREGAEKLVEIARSIRPQPRPPHAVVVGRTDHAALFRLTDATVVRTQFAPCLGDGFGETVDAPPLRRHGVLDLPAMRAEIDTAVARLKAATPAPTVFVAHNPVLAP